MIFSILHFGLKFYYLLILSLNLVFRVTRRWCVCNKLEKSLFFCRVWIWSCLSFNKTFWSILTHLHFALVHHEAQTDP